MRSLAGSTVASNAGEGTSIARPLASKTVEKRITLLSALINSGKFKAVNPTQKIPKPKDDGVLHEPFDQSELQQIFSA